jgi:hypothetical protein
MKAMLAFTAKSADFYIIHQWGIKFRGYLSNGMRGPPVPDDVILSPQEFWSVHQRQFSGNRVRTRGINRNLSLTWKETLASKVKPMEA